MIKPRYPIYVVSKGRWQRPLTIRFLLKDEQDFKVVVEKEEVPQYEKIVGKERLLVLPVSGLKLIGARNFVKDHSTAAGDERHWILDDNMRMFRRTLGTRRIPCDSRLGMKVIEDFTDRFERVALSGPNYSMFVIPTGPIPPFYVNHRVYSAMLVNNAIPYRWRAIYNDDTDMALQALSEGWYTILVNAFTVDKIRTGLMKGGNTTDLYQGDGRTTMARSLERMWPGVVKTIRRFKRPQHYVDWRIFHKPLILKPGVDIDTFPKIEEYGMHLEQQKPIKAETVRNLLRERE